MTYIPVISLTIAIIIFPISGTNLLLITIALFGGCLFTSIFNDLDPERAFRKFVKIKKTLKNIPAGAKFTIIDRAPLWETIPRGRVIKSCDDFIVGCSVPAQDDVVLVKGDVSFCDFHSAKTCQFTTEQYFWIKLDTEVLVLPWSL